jgi:hypothetical protein
MKQIFRTLICFSLCHGLTGYLYARPLRLNEYDCRVGVIVGPHAHSENWPAVSLDTIGHDKARRSDVTIDSTTLRGKSGFYRIARSAKGRWWLLEPNGKPMIYKGCNAVIRQEVGKAGENMYFQWVEQTYGADH